MIFHCFSWISIGFHRFPLIFSFSGHLPILTVFVRIFSSLKVPSPAQGQSVVYVYNFTRDIWSILPGVSQNRRPIWILTSHSQMFFKLTPEICSILWFAKSHQNRRRNLKPTYTQNFRSYQSMSLTAPLFTKFGRF